MRLLISEFLCSGAWPEATLPESLAREGRGMLSALLGDLVRIPGVRAVSTWDARLGPIPTCSRNSEVGNREPAAMRSTEPDAGVAAASGNAIEWTVIGTPEQEWEVFRRAAAECDAAYVIAPELDDLLTRRCDAVRAAGGTCLNPTSDCLQLCSDKWETWKQLARADVPTVPAYLLESGGATNPFGYPAVLKPRFGAGSYETHLVNSPAELAAVAARFNPSDPVQQAIIQPFVRGEACSVAAIFRSDGSLREVWPATRQILSDDGHFRYLGGRMPVPEIEAGTIRRLLESAGAAIPGMRGYIGFDFIVSGDGAPRIVDINPRLTTSYLGYRLLAACNLAERILWPDGRWAPTVWKDAVVDFAAE